ncbi:DNA-directed RNA polymerase subunit beta [bacterium]|nr:DNA-directed RNA polymerase subunit beta [bacterium]
MKVYEDRTDFTKTEPVVPIPNLLSVQISSYGDFLQLDVPNEEREKKGLEEVFRSNFPIEDLYGKYTLDYINYQVGKPRFNIDECRIRNMTYSGSLKVRLKLIEWEGEGESRRMKEAREGEVYLGEIPLITNYGTFVINGAERVVVSQLHRSPGVFFDEVVHPNGKRLFSARIIPYRGSWIELKFDIREAIWVYFDTRRKTPITTLLRAFGYDTDKAIIELFHEVKTYKVHPQNKRHVVGNYAADTLFDFETGVVHLQACEQITEEKFDELVEAQIDEVPFFKLEQREIPVILASLKADTTTSYEEAVREVFSIIRPGDVLEEEGLSTMLETFLFNDKRYDLGEVGRYKMDQRLGINIPISNHALSREDFLEISRYLIVLRHGKGNLDDIDHLGVRRARSVGELVENQVRVGLARMSRTVRERMRLRDVETLTPSDLINARTVSAVINSFFGSSQLSQFMDQINPLAELTHKRRLSALGPGGLSRERAGFEVRDVHYTHYGRMCPIETPEGQNIGLITSLSVYGRINKYGFIETPYRKVINRKVTSDVVYLTSDEEDRYTIAQANAKVDEKGMLVNDKVFARHRADIIMAPSDKIDFIDVSPTQLVSVSAALIPFLEHDDANRALMGSNMQRQSVPLMVTTSPVVGTGVERRAALDSGAVVVAKRGGTVTYVDANTVDIKPAEVPEEFISIEDVDRYDMSKFRRSNQNTSINQRPVVKKGDLVEEGGIIADGAATKGGKLALGKNLLVAFMPWYGYNYEDAIIISEKCVKEDIFTSVHVEEFELQVRETKRGPEELTRELPNVSDEAIMNLDKRGIIVVGSEVESGDILVGRVTPKGETEASPEERLLRAIFGDKAGDVKDASLKAPPGMKGVVIDTVLLERKKSGKNARKKEKEIILELTEKYEDEIGKIRTRRDEILNNFLMGKRAKDIFSQITGEQLIDTGKKISTKLIENINFEDLDPKSDWTSTAKTNKQIRKILRHAKMLIEDKLEELKIEKDKIVRGDELPPGVLQMVKVHVAMKRKISVGDKMAGRHGNKGVISKIVPTEDMPYLKDGTPVDIILNPLGVPSRMNIGQILETHLGWAVSKLGYPGAETPVFNGGTIGEIKELMKKAGIPETGKVTLYDGLTGNAFQSPVTVGIIYMMKLSHLADDKIHARSIGPYSLVTQQPLGGKAQFGGQRFGEMEVWALEAYGAAHTLQEILTYKSDDVRGRAKMYEAIVKGENPPEAGIPESFNVLVKEMRGLGIDVQLLEDEEH